MAVRTRRKNTRKTSKRGWIIPDWIGHYLPVWILLAGILFVMLPRLLPIAASAAWGVIEETPGAAVSAGGIILEVAVDAGAVVLNLTGDAISAAGDFVSGLFKRDGRRLSHGELAPLFTSEVAYWSGDISRWAAEYNLDPNLLATVMQIESCGHPTVSSPAGAQGLFQVMPYHFTAGENQLDPDTNARRGAGVLNDCLRWSGGDTGLAMACYNGGPSVLRTNFTNWHPEPQRYFRWGTGIYADAQRHATRSATLDSWLAAGGSHLCRRAADVQSSRR